MAKKELKATYFPEIDPLLQTEEDPRISGTEILPGSIPWDRMGVGPLDVTNQLVPGTTAGDASIIRTGGPNTPGLYIRGDAFVNPGTTVVDSYAATGTNAYSLGGSFNTIVSQSFTSDVNITLDSVVLLLGRESSLTGNVTATICAHTGTYGTNSIPGTLLATSDNVAASTLTQRPVEGTLYETTFTFSGAERITLVAGTYYCVTVNYSLGSAGSFVYVRYQSSATHDGNAAAYSGSWTASAIRDLYFRVNGTDSTVLFAANLQEWQDSDGTALSIVGPTGIITAPSFVSTIAIGASPITVTSTTKVTNLNADLLDGVHASTFANIALDNLASVAINTSLTSDADSTDDLGSSSKYWANLYADKVLLNATATLDGSTAGRVKITAVDVLIAPDATWDGTDTATLYFGGTTNYIFSTRGIASGIAFDNEIYFQSGNNADINIIPDGSGTIQLAKNTTVTGTFSATNLTSVEITDLTDSGDSTLHYHSNDRDRANHTGTQAMSTISDIPTLASGTYAPTRSAEVNLDANVTMSQAQYLRIGSTVTVSGEFTANPTLAATATSFEITLPISSNIGATEDVAGVAFCGSITGQGAEIIGVVANDTAKIQWVSGDITDQTWSFIFTYQVI